MESAKLTDAGYLPAGADVDKIALIGDDRYLMAVRATYFHRRMLADMLAEIEDEAERRLWEQDLAATAEVTPLQALACANRLARRITGSRWYVMRDAREAGASWAEIGEALDMSKQAAQEWYSKKIAEQEKHLPGIHDAARSRAVLDHDAGA